MAHSRALLRLALPLAFAIALPAAAQDVPVRDQLLGGVACSGRDQVEQILLNADRLVLEPVVVNEALTRIAADPETCEAIQGAALDASTQLAQRAAEQQAQILEGARLRLEDALRAADQQAASASFEVGPPPRNLTRGAGQGD